MAAKWFNSLDTNSSMDANQWTGIKAGRQRALSVWSANSTALRVSIAKALNQKNNLIATSRRPTTTTLLSVNPSGLRNGKVTKGQIKPKADWRAVDSPKKQTNKFVSFAFLHFTANKTNSFVCFFTSSFHKEYFCRRTFWIQFTSLAAQLKCWTAVQKLQTDWALVKLVQLRFL